jgi:hypothetical protein
MIPGCGQLDVRIGEQNVRRHNIQTGDGCLMHCERFALKDCHVESLLDGDLLIMRE